MQQSDARVFSSTLSTNGICCNIVVHWSHRLLLALLSLSSWSLYLFLPIIYGVCQRLIKRGKEWLLYVFVFYLKWITLRLETTASSIVQFSYETYLQNNKCITVCRYKTIFLGCPLFVVFCSCLLLFFWFVFIFLPERGSENPRWFCA